MNMPLWYQNAIFYELNVRAFSDSNGDGHGDLRGVVQHLDHLQALGVDCIWLLPIYPSPLRDDGYDVADFCAVHPDYGSLDDFKALVTAAHQRGLRVITDLILNHTSDQHPWFQASRAARDAPLRDFYVWSDTDRKYADARIIFIDTEPSNWTFDPRTGQYYWHRFFSHQPDLNFDHPPVQQAMLDVVRFWLDLGVDGFRADAVPYLYEREGTSCENLPETHAYLKRIRAFMDAGYAGRILLSEANQWPEDTRAYFGDGDEFHLAFHFPLMPRIFLALARGNRQPILDILARTPSIPATCQWCTFLRCHDELTLEMVTPEERAFLWDFYAPEPRMRLNLGIRRRLAPLLNNDRRRIELANSLLFTLPGTPVIYYGDEIGMGDNIWLPDRNGVRTPMQWSAGVNAGFSAAPADRLYSPVIDDPAYGYRAVNVAAQQADPRSLYHTVRRMIQVRKEQPCLGAGAFHLVETGQPAVFAYRRTLGSDSVLVINNLSGWRQGVALDIEVPQAHRLRDLISGDVVPPERWQTTPLQIDSFQYLWLKLEP
jgi:maltose alpha-D-glucosyltransferase/alpha-amylase